MIKYIKKGESIMLRITYINSSAILSVIIIGIIIVMIGFVLSIHSYNSNILFLCTLPLAFSVIIMCWFTAFNSNKITDAKDIIAQLNQSKISISSVDAKELSDKLRENDEYTFNAINGQTLHFYALGKIKKGFYATTTYKVDVIKKE